MINLRRQIYISIVIGLTAGLTAYYFDPFHAPGDLFQALRPARDFIENRPPLWWTMDPGYVPSPLTITPLGLPWVFMEEQAAGAIFFGITGALLAWVLRKRTYLLPLFASYAFVQNLGARQYAPLLMALALTGLPAVGVIIKPHIALPLFLMYRSHRVGVMIAIVVTLWTLIVFPGWPVTWLSQLSTYTGTFPVLHPLGLIAFGLAVVTRQPLLALYCLVPLRRMYDALPLFLAVRDIRPVAALTVFSWLMMLLPQPDQLPAFCLSAVAAGWLFGRWAPAAADPASAGAPLDVALKWLGRLRAPVG